MLSCECDYDNDSADWYFDSPKDFSRFMGSRRKKCFSCGKLISLAGCCLKFNRHRDAFSDIEDRIYGDEVPLAPWYLCEKCGEIYLNLTAAGYCLEMGDMRQAQKEYWNLTGFVPKENNDSITDS